MDGIRSCFHPSRSDQKEFFLFRILIPAFLVCLLARVDLTAAQKAAIPQTHSVRPTPPTRDPKTPGYVTATDLPDGTNAPPNVDGNFILGPTHNPAPEMTV